MDKLVIVEQAKFTRNDYFIRTHHFMYICTGEVTSYYQLYLSEPTFSIAFTTRGAPPPSVANPLILKLIKFLFLWIPRINYDNNFLNYDFNCLLQNDEKYI